MGALRTRFFGIVTSFYAPGILVAFFLIFNSFGAYLDAAGAFLAWLGRESGAAAFTAVWCSQLASQIGRKQLNWYGRKAPMRMQPSS